MNYFHFISPKTGLQQTASVVAISITILGHLRIGTHGIARILDYFLTVSRRQCLTLLKLGMEEQDLGIWNHLGVVVNWLLGAYRSSWGSCWGPVNAPREAPREALIKGLGGLCRKLLGKAPRAYKSL
jgi:hypothetical protein